jgi:thiol-disulfide isomerase/thioredoxin
MKKVSILLLFFWALQSRAQGLKPVGEKELLNVFKSSTKRTIINFWATWCIPCVEEMPFFVTADSFYRSQLDFVFVSFDMLRDTNRVKQKITDLNIPGRHYLLRVTDMDAFINSVDSLWGGALPVTWIVQKGMGKGHYESFEQFKDLKGFIDHNIKKEE